MPLHYSLASDISEKHITFNFKDEVQVPNLKMKGIMPVQCTRQHTIMSYPKPKTIWSHLNACYEYLT
jgi:hypothetical protein